MDIQEEQLAQMLASLRLADERKKNREASSTAEAESSIADADRGTLRTGQLALSKIKSSRFDDRETAKLEFLNLFHTFKNFRVNARKT